MERLLALFRRHGVQVWLPEAGGPVDLDTPEHRALVRMLGAQQLREVVRARHRAMAAMRALTEHGRYLGGRAPYGYRLVEAGPHPHPAGARRGRTVTRLEPDPQTAPTVRWLFAERLAGRSIEDLVETLNQRRTPCPAEHDPARNTHRAGRRWTAETVTTILRNPRYTGWQVWNRQTVDHDHHSPTDQRRRTTTKRKPTNGSCPASAPTPRWSANTTSSPSNASAPNAPTSTENDASTCWQVYCAAARADNEWNPGGRTDDPATAAATTAAHAPRPRHRPSTSAKSN
ncbi:recombinase family protein [Saccharothrix variisporea]|uniref:recombinase family protein n=1 Tax=Saccharothrix variisporea TaxID=543527 RepID=UPI0014770A63|nr:recombinase family protein [Saccharothrix variisporea]